MARGVKTTSAQVAGAKAKRPARRAKNGAGLGRRRADKQINFGPLQDWVGFNLRIAQEAALLVFMRGSKMVGGRPGRFGTLTLIAHNPGISQTDLSEAAGRDKSSITPVVEDLVRNGLVARSRDVSDRRTCRLRLTPAGTKVRKTMERYVRGHEEKLDRILGRDRAKFIALLKRIATEIV